jgi:hypothetical protein
MNTILANPDIQIVGNYKSQQSEIDLMPIGIMKGMSLNKALKSYDQYPIVEQVLKLMVIDIADDKLSIAVKVTQHDINTHVCIPGWHIDTVRNFLDPRPIETHYLWVSHTGTEFLNNKIELDSTLGIIDFCDIVDKIETEEIIKTKPNDIIMYNRYNLHRGCKSESNEKRLLIRVSKEK